MKRKQKKQQRGSIYEIIGIIVSIVGAGIIYYIMNLIFGIIIGLISAVWSFFVFMGFWIFIGNLFRAVEKAAKK